MSEPVDSVSLREHFTALLAEKDKALVLNAEILRREMSGQAERLEPIRERLTALERVQAQQYGRSGAMAAVWGLGGAVVVAAIAALLARVLR